MPSAFFNVIECFFYNHIMPSALSSILKGCHDYRRLHYLKSRRDAMIIEDNTIFNPEGMP